MARAHRIDIQHHILPPDYVRLVGEDAISRLIVSGRMPDWTPEVSLEVMDRNNIELAVTSLSAPGFHQGDGAAAAELARYCNEYAAGLCSTYPGRFGMFATLPMPHVEETLAEIEYCFDVLAADGVCFLTNYKGRYPGDASFAPVLEALNRRGAVIFIHPADVWGGHPLDQIPAATLEFPFETTRAIVSMLYSGSLTRNRDSRFIFSHAGGAVPYIADRIARLQRRPDFNQHVPVGAIAELNRLHFDVALSANKRIFASLLQLVPADNILFASDYPFAGEDTVTATATGLAELGLDKHALAAIERGNALQLMPNLFTRRSSLRGAAE